MRTGWIAGIGGKGHSRIEEGGDGNVWHAPSLPSQLNKTVMDKR